MLIASDVGDAKITARILKKAMGAYLKEVSTFCCVAAGCGLLRLAAPAAPANDLLLSSLTRLVPPPT